MKTRIYTIFYKYDANQIEWHDFETDFTEEEVEKKLRQLRRDYPGMTFRKAFSREAEMQTVTARESGTYIPIRITEESNWAGEKYLLFVSQENGAHVAEVDFIKGGFRIFGYKTNIWDLRRSRVAAINCAKRRVQEFFDAIGDKRPIVFC